MVGYAGWISWHSTLLDARSGAWRRMERDAPLFQMVPKPWRSSYNSDTYIGKFKDCLCITCPSISMTPVSTQQLHVWRYYDTMDVYSLSS